MIRIAMLSKWHVHAKDYQAQLQQRSDVQITAVWDEDADRGAAWARELGAAFEADLDSCLARADVDAVVVVTPTNLHPDVIIKAANAGKHIFTEKVLAFTVKDCLRIKEAVQRNRVQFCISLPYRTFPNNLYAKQMLDSGVLGDPTLMLVRTNHDGSIAGWLPPHFYDAELCGGGAMIDLGAHPMYLSAWLLGKPRRITSMFVNTTGKPVEDNAACLIEFENGAIAIPQTNFVSGNSKRGFEIHGTKGSLVFEDPDLPVNVYASGVETDADGHPLSPLPAEAKMPIDQWLDAIQGTDTVQYGIDDAVALTELMEGAYRSAREGRTVCFDELARE
ncbi:MAG: Gfo/Idh/MocA family oxidoreductase [Eubacteriales bacterium]|nr:Gfo/Idh/MocA family oxidoreductase [Eubacteriales bacterium]